MSDKLNQQYIENAATVANKIENVLLRKRALVLNIAADVACDCLNSKGIAVTSKNSLYCIPEIAKEIEIADIYFNNIRIDVRVTFDDKHFYIPKIQEKYDVAPTVYVVLKMDKNLFSYELLGFVSHDELEFERNNNDYYGFDSSILRPIEGLASFLADLNVDVPVFAFSEHTKIKEMAPQFLSGDISESEKIFFIKHVVACPVCRELLSVFNGFDNISVHMKNYPELLNDSTLSVLSGNKVEIEQVKNLELLDLVDEEEESPAEFEESEDKLANDVLDEDLSVLDNELPAASAQESLSDNTADDSQLSENDDIETVLETEPVVEESEMDSLVDESVIEADENSIDVSDLENIALQEEESSSADFDDSAVDELNLLSDTEKTDMSLQEQDITAESEESLSLEESDISVNPDDSYSDVLKEVEEFSDNESDEAESVLSEEQDNKAVSDSDTDSIDELSLSELDDLDIEPVDDALSESDNAEEDETEDIEDSDISETNNIEEEQASEQTTELEESEEASFEETDNENDDLILEESDNIESLEEQKEEDSLDISDEVSELQNDIDMPELETIDVDDSEVLLGSEDEVMEEIEPTSDDDFVLDSSDEVLNLEQTADEEKEIYEQETTDELVEDTESLADEQISSTDTDMSGLLEDEPVSLFDAQQNEIDSFMEENPLTDFEGTEEETTVEEQDSFGSEIDSEDKDEDTSDSESTLDSYQNEVQSEGMAPQYSTVDSHNTGDEEEYSEPLNIVEEEADNIETDTTKPIGESIPEEESFVASEESSEHSEESVQPQPEAESPQSQEVDSELQDLLDDDLMALLSGDDEDNTSTETYQENNIKEQHEQQDVQESTVDEENVEQPQQEENIETLFEEEADTPASSQDFPAAGILLGGSSAPQAGHSFTKKLITAGLLIVLAAGGGGFAWFMSQNKNAGTENDAALDNANQSDSLFDFQNQDNSQDNQQAAIPQDINKSMANSFSDKPAAITVTKISWQVSEKLAADNSVKEYLQTAGKNIQMNLQNDLAFASDAAFNNAVKISIVIAPDNTLKGMQVLESSGSDKIDEIIQRSIKNTLKYVSVPKIKDYKSDYFFTIVINF